MEFLTREADVLPEPWIRTALMSAVLEYKRLRAPRGHGEVLLDPPWGDLDSFVAENRARFRHEDCDLQGQSLQQLRDGARRGLLRAARQYTAEYRDVPETSCFDDGPLLLAGHQPQLFHAGVWFKNFALSSLGARLEAAAVNLLIDNDILPTAAIRVPRRTAAGWQVEAVSFDGAGEGLPYEERTIRDPPWFESFGERVVAAMGRGDAPPLLQSYWPRVLAASRRSRNLGRCLAEARHCVEGQWGQRTLELPLSVACTSPAFAWFTAHLLAQLPRLHDIYNTSLAEYRRVNRVRSRSHPVPDLAHDGAWREAPFWLWTADAPRRRRLFVRRHGDALELTDRARCQLTLPLSRDGQAHGAVEQLQACSARGIRLRPRALITTMYIRLVLADLFLHGIGGAKYDQLTDVIIARFFRLQPPRFATLSATALLFPDHTPALRDELRRTKQTLRELRFSPERHTPQTAEVAPLIAEKIWWLAQSPSRGQRMARHRGIDRVNLALQPWLAAQVASLTQRRAGLSDELRRQATLASREFAFCLFSEAQLRPLLLDLSQQVP